MIPGSTTPNQTSHMAPTLKLDGFTTWHTGGGCTALGRKFTGFHMLVTAVDDAQAPESFPVLAGTYFGDQDEIGGDEDATIWEGEIADQAEFDRIVAEITFSQNNPS